jgi:5-methylcytosine-specific restriction endonuclease McrA
MIKKTKSIAYYRRKADQAVQEWGRDQYSICLICGKPMSCLHHYFPKSSSSNLRYDRDNLIPICVSCHFKHHNGDPRVQNTINVVKGKAWLSKLTEKRNIYIKVNKKYYQDVIERYSIL